MILCEHAATLLQLRPCLILDSFGPHLYTRPLPSSLLRLISLSSRDWQFATAEVLVQALNGPAVKVPPPVLQVDGFINQEYFGVLAGKFLRSGLIRQLWTVEAAQLPSTLC